MEEANEEYVEVIVDYEKMPKPDPTKNCECMKRPIQFRLVRGQAFWQVEEGDRVKKGELICEGEADKKVVEFFSPCDGVIDKIFIKDEEIFKGGMVLCRIKKHPENRQG